ncbi:MAG: hemerythrin domain-containing protein [Acidobacteriota bacterium]|nr:hemerythrin domain-containing protein [Acidobacteriota bacterium]
MVTTYSVNWRSGEEAPTAGMLEVTPDAVVFTPADGGAVEEVPFADIPAVRRRSSTVELERLHAEPIRIESVTAGMLGECLESAFGLAETIHALRADHDRIGEALGELRVAVESIAELDDARAHEIGLLAADLMRRVVSHAHVEERELYPVVERLLGCRPLVETMLFDHRAIEGEACGLVRVEAGDRARFARAFHRLDALVTTHVAKEEAVVLPLLDRR